MASSGSHQLSLGQLTLDTMLVPSDLKSFPAPDAFDLAAVKVLKKGNTVLLKNDAKPCKLLDIQKSKTGKHGVSKYHVRGVHVLTGKKVDDLFFTGDSVKVPEEKKDQYHVLNVSEDGLLTLQSVSHPSETREDLSVDLDNEDDKLASMISELYWEGEACVVTVYSCLGFEHVVSVAVEKGAAFGG